jgi:16S rRNA (uracil1498-N3)-methyltransferase
MELFYCSTIENNIAHFDETEAAHCLRVLRHKAGDTIALTDGKGTIHKGIIEVSGKQCMVNIYESKTMPPRNRQLHVAIAPPKAIDRFEWFLEKATEIGIEEITPLLCFHSERKHLNVERCNKILISAIKQSNRSYLPLLHPLTPAEQFIIKHSAEHKYIAHCSEADDATLHQLIKQNASATIMIGPEGDFSASEINKALQSGYKSLSLGHTRLRTETAAVYVCSAFSLMNEQS